MMAARIALPLQGWMQAADDILIWVGDFRCLASTCSIVTLAHLDVLAGLAIAATLLPNEPLRCALRWMPSTSHSWEVAPSPTACAFAAMR